MFGEVTVGYQMCTVPLGKVYSTGNLLVKIVEIFLAKESKAASWEGRQPTSGGFQLTYATYWYRFLEVTGRYCFGHCDRFLGITREDGTSVPRLDDFAFGECFAVKSICISASVTVLGAGISAE
jgi:hypothetical protein